MSSPEMTPPAEHADAAAPAGGGAATALPPPCPS